MIEVAEVGTDDLLAEVLGPTLGKPAAISAFKGKMLMILGALSMVRECRLQGRRACCNRGRLAVRHARSYILEAVGTEVNIDLFRRFKRGAIHSVFGPKQLEHVPKIPKFRPLWVLNKNLPSFLQAIHGDLGNPPDDWLPISALGLDLLLQLSQHFWTY